MRGLCLAVIGVLLFSHAVMAQPANNPCAGATTVTAGLPAATGTNAGATIDGPVPTCVNSNGPDVWYRYVTTAGSGPVIIDTCGSTFDTILTVYLSSCPTSNSNQIACDDDGATCGPQPFRQSRVTITNPSPAGGDVLLIRVHGFGGATGNIVLNINTCAPQIISTIGGGNTCGQSFQTVGVNAVGANPTYQWFAENVNQPIPDTNSPQLSVPIAGIRSHTFLCRVTTACGSVLSEPIVFNNNEFPVFTTNPPPSVVFCEGGSSTLQVAATGGDNSFQWRRGTLPILGATAPSLNIPPIPENTGEYSCVVTNTCGQNVSQVCFVDVGGPLHIVGPGSQFATIQAAIDALPGCGRVLVLPGTYVENISFGSRRVGLRSSDGPAVTIIDGSAAGTAAVACTSGSPLSSGSSIEGFTIVGGRGADFGGVFVGGGVAILGSGESHSFSISNCVIAGNRANFGGGIGAFSTNLTLDAVTISSNRAQSSPAIGGGLGLNNSSVTADRCEIADNLALGGSGGGVIIEAGTPTGSRFSNCLIRDNIAEIGPGGGGGGVRILDASARFLNCTIVRNLTGGAGTAFRLEPLANVAIVNSIIAANGANTPVFFAGQPPIASFSCIQPNANLGAGGLGNIIADPGFTSANNFRLGPASPCVDAGSVGANTPASFATDLDGESRVVDDPAIADTGVPGPGAGTLDMGCFERQSSPTNRCPLSPLLAADSIPFSTLTATTDGPNEGDLACTSDPSFMDDVWFRYVPGCTGNLSIALCESNFDTMIAVYRGDACPSAPGQVAACNDDSECGLQSRVSLGVTAGEMLLVRVAGFLGANGSGTVTITCQPACTVDLNGDGNVDPDDLADAIACFFGPGCTLDINNDGIEDPDDLADYIAFFFGGCP